MKLYLAVRHLSVSIRRRPGEVYAFAANPEKLPLWASGLSTSAVVRGDGGVGLAQSPMGKVQIRFAPENPFGVLDHDVTVESGETFHNPMRVVPNAEGAEVTFTLFRRPEMSDAQWQADARTIEADLATLKRLLES